MFPELNTLCDISPGDPPLGKSLFVEGESLDSSFIAHHFASTYLRTGHRVCLLALAHPFNHYASVGNKLGVNMTKARDDGQFVFIEGLKFIGGQILTLVDSRKTSNISSASSGSTTDNPESAVNPGIDYKDNRHSSLKGLYDYCVEQIKTLLNTRPKVDVGDNVAEVPYLFIVDDISVFSLLGVDSLDVIYFFMALREFVLTHGRGSLLTQTSIGPNTTDDKLDTVRQHIHHQSDLVFTVNDLQTGYSKDVHGQITIFNKTGRIGEPPNTTRRMQFKISDKNVNFFPAGMSSAVL